MIGMVGMKDFTKKFTIIIESDVVSTKVWMFIKVRRMTRNRMVQMIGYLLVSLKNNDTFYSHKIFENRQKQS